MKVYADNAATTKMSKAARDVMVEYIDSYYGNPSSLYEIGQTAAVQLMEARESIARCINADAKEIYFTSGGSEADNQAILSAAEYGKKKGKKHIISTAFEHHAVLHTLKKLEREGFEVTYLDVHENGIVTAEEVDAAIKDDTVLVTIMYANNEIGTIQPIKEIGAVCRKRGVWFHTDAVQAAGHVAIDVENDNIDMLSISAHKFHGPKGCGALYAKKGIPLANLIEGGAQERGKRAGTENLPAIAAMATALCESCAHIDEATEKVSALRDRLIEGISKIPHSRLNGDRQNRLPLLLLLDFKGISASSGSACTSGSLDPSHVLLAIGLPHEVAHGSLRLSISDENTEEEMDYIVKSVGEVVEYLRDMSPVWDDLVKGRKEFYFE